MPHRSALLAACAGLSLACGSTSPEACQEWDASVREVVANVEGALPSDARRRSFDEDYQFVAKDLGLVEKLAACVEEGHLEVAEAASEPDPGADVAFIDVLKFGEGKKPVTRALRDVDWSCKAGGQCTGSYAKGPATMALGFESDRLVQVGVQLQDLPTRVQDIVAKTDADVFAARKALIEKAVADLETRFGTLTKIRDGVEDGGVRMEWAGRDGTRQLKLEFTEKGQSLAFWIRDGAVAAEVAEAAAAAPAKRAESYFE